MFESNDEIIAKIMPDENTILILKKDLQTHQGVVPKGTRIVLFHPYYLNDGYEVILSDTFCYIYLSEIIRDSGERHMLPFEVFKYPQRIQKFVREYFMIDFDRTKEYKSYLEREKKHINIGLILFSIFCLASFIFITIMSNLLWGVLCSCIELIGMIAFGILAIQFIDRKNEKRIKELLR